MTKTHVLPAAYPALLSELKERIRTARLRAALSVNSEMIALYYSIGRAILDKQEQEAWGTKIIERLARDLKAAFPASKGFSRRNLLYMKQFAESYENEEIAQGALAQIPWYHHIALLDKIKDSTQRKWYAAATREHGWSRDVLVHQIAARLYERQGNAVTNFSRTLPKADSDLAQQATKDSYHFDFLGLNDEYRERQLQRGLIENITAFLLELGKGFSFMGSQYHLEVSNKDYYLDLLFYHVKLRRYVIFDLKTKEFQPAYAGQMNFYLSAVDDLLRHPDDKPSIGIILCRTHDAVTVDYALRDMKKPMGVAEYRVTGELPDQFHSKIPTAQDFVEGLKRRKLPRPKDS